MMGALAAAQASAPKLYRGTSAAETAPELLRRLPAGFEPDIPLASFTSSRVVAEEFAWVHVDQESATEVLFLLHSGSRAVRVDLLAPDEIHWLEREWYSGGRFVVVETRVTTPGCVEVSIEQKGVYDVG